MSLAEQIREQELKALGTLITWFGSQTALAGALGYSDQVVSNWVARGRISAQGAIKAEAATNGEIKKESLRPAVQVWFTGRK